jgi:hypothetical protein
MFKQKDGGFPMLAFLVDHGCENVDCLAEKHNRN